MMQANEDARPEIIGEGQGDVFLGNVPCSFLRPKPPRLIAPNGDPLEQSDMFECSVYRDRPLICRLFGLVDHPRMRCEHGCTPTFWLSSSYAGRLHAKARELIKRHVERERRKIHA